MAGKRPLPLIYNSPVGAKPNTPATERAAADRRPLAVGLAGVVLFVWLMNTPAGALGKADAIGYAVCHRIDLRSFHLGERALPLCSRCTGMYLGSLLAFVTLSLAGRGRWGGFPAARLIPFLTLFLVAFAVDGVNSYLHFFPNAPHLYQPSNVLRLITGTGLGLGMGAIVLAGFNQNSWVNWSRQPVLGSPSELLLLAAMGALVVLLALSGNPLILYPLAILSSLGVILLLTSVYSVLAMLVLRLENRATRWTDLLLPIGLGLTGTMVHIGAFNLVRYSLFGTWSGFTL